MDFGDVLAQSRALAARQQLELSAGSSVGYNNTRNTTSVHGFSPSSRTHGDQIPRLERDLSQIDAESRRIFHSHPYVNDSHQYPSTGDTLLAEYGFETNRLERSLQSIALLDTYEPLIPFSDADLDAFTRQQNELSILAAVDIARTQSSSLSLQFNLKSFHNTWNSIKRELVTDTAFVPLPKTTASSQQSSVQNYTQVLPSSTTTNGSYASAIHTILFDSTHETTAAKLLEYSSVQQNRSNSAQLLFFALRYICSGSTDGTNFRSDSTDLHVNSIRCLERLFLDGKLRPAIESQPIAARRGGYPGIISDVRAYLNLHGMRALYSSESSFTFEGFPLWPQIYLCIRCGDWSAAESIVSNAQSIFESNGLQFASFFTAFIRSGSTRRLPMNSLKQLIHEYKSTAYQSNDVMRRACYILLARVDLSGLFVLYDSDFELLFNSIEDYLWLQLSIAPNSTEDVERMNTELCGISEDVKCAKGLKGIQEEVQTFGAVHFDRNGENPLFYGFVLVLCGLFENAVKYMLMENAHQKYSKDAIHAAFCMFWYGLIDNELYADVLWRYIRPMLTNQSGDSVATAAMYAMTLLGGDEKGKYCGELLKRIVLQSGCIDMLLGNGKSRKKGLLNDLIGAFVECGNAGVVRSAVNEHWIKDIVLDAARDAEEYGDIAVATQLYDRLELIEPVLILLGRQLSANLMSRGVKSREDAWKSARDFELRLRNDANFDRSISSYGPVIRSFRLLLQLYDWLELVWIPEKSEAAWTCLKSMNWLPLSSDLVLIRAAELRSGSNEYTDAVIDCVPEILLAAMELIVSRHTELRRAQARAELSAYRNATAAELAADRAELITAAQSLINFSGMLQFPYADVSARLIRLQVMLS